MPRRVIYIKNPKEGSNFRTIGSGGTSSGTSSSSSSSSNNWPSNPQQPSQDSPMTADEWNSQYNQPVNQNWAVGDNPFGPGWDTADIDYTGMYFGQLSANQVPGWQGFDTYFFQPASTLLGMLVDIASGVDPYTGQFQPGIGYPGTLTFSPFGPSPFGTGYGNFPGTYAPGSVPVGYERPWWSP